MNLPALYQSMLNAFGVILLRKVGAVTVVNVSIQTVFNDMLKLVPVHVITLKQLCN